MVHSFVANPVDPGTTRIAIGTVRMTSRRVLGRVVDRSVSSAILDRGLILAKYFVEHAENNQSSPEFNRGLERRFVLTLHIVRATVAVVSGAVPVVVSAFVDETSSGGRYG